LLTSPPDKIRVDVSDLGQGVYFREQFIIFIDGSGVSFFSGKCTHAGCTINRESSGELICSCHGSRFEASTGRVLKGPALLPLKKLQHWYDPKTGETIVKI